MKKLVFLPVLILSLVLHSQTNDSPGKKHYRKGPSFRKDSIGVILQKMKDSFEKTIQAVPVRDDIGRNITEMLKPLEEKRTKEKRKAILYIMIGIAGFIVLIISLRRRTAGRSK